MKKWTAVDRALTPDGKTISLEEHDGSYFIRVDGAPLMSTRQHASEERIAELACEHLKGKRNTRVLIGGLGFGFTLKATLAALPADATVVVAEILAAVIDWNRNPAYPLAAHALADPRVSVVHRDVAEAMRAEHGGFDSIILDVDNGPAAFTTGGNDRLYDATGLRLTRSTLRPGGCVAYWSAAPDAAFKTLLAQAGFTVEVHRSRARGNAGARHTLFLGRVQ